MTNNKNDSSCIKEQEYEGWEDLPMPDPDFMNPEDLEDYLNECKQDTCETDFDFVDNEYIYWNDDKPRGPVPVDVDEKELQVIVENFEDKVIMPFVDNIIDFLKEDIKLTFPRYSCLLDAIDTELALYMKDWEYIDQLSYERVYNHYYEQWEDSFPAEETFFDDVEKIAIQKITASEDELKKYFAEDIQRWEANNNA